MNQTTKETRRRSYDAVLPKRAARCRLILETLGNRELTASEITEELVAAGRIPYFNRNYVAPRLTELKEIGILTTVGRLRGIRAALLHHGADARLHGRDRQEVHQNNRKDNRALRPSRPRATARGDRRDLRA